MRFLRHMLREFQRDRQRNDEIKMIPHNLKPEWLNQVTQTGLNQSN